MAGCGACPFLGLRRFDQPGSGPEIRVSAPADVYCSSTTAECFALIFAANSKLPGSVQIYSDSKAMIAAYEKFSLGFARSAAWALAAKTHYDLADDSIQFLWTKAHRSPADVHPADWSVFVGNKLAGEAAEKASAAFSPDADYIKLRKEYRKQSYLFLKEVVAALSSFSNTVRHASGPFGPPPLSLPRVRHRPQPHRYGWWCTQCFSTFRRLAGDATKQVCRSDCSRFLTVAAGSLSQRPPHDLHFARASDGKPVMFCSRCGSYSSGRTFALATGGCLTVVAGRVRLCVARVHPVSRLPVAGFRRLDQSALAYVRASEKLLAAFYDPAAEPFNDLVGGGRYCRLLKHPTKPLQRHRPRWFLLRRKNHLSDLNYKMHQMIFLLAMWVSLHVPHTASWARFCITQLVRWRFVYCKW